MYESIRFGKYEWLILDKFEGNIALILAKNSIEQRAYHSRRAKTTWEKCTMRQYLNHEFYNTFSEGDKARIQNTKIATNDNPWFGTDGGTDTFDKAFLLSLEEVVQYLGNSKAPLKQAKMHSPDSWNDEKSSYYISNYDNKRRKAYDKNGAECWWWLRTPGDDKKSAALVSVVGAVSSGNVNCAGGVRPAMVVKL